MALHFAIQGAGKTACGKTIFLVEDATDDRQHVDCDRCKRTKQMRDYDPARFDVDVWNHDGEVVKHFRNQTSDQVDEIRRNFKDEPLDVVVAEVAPAGS